MINGEIYPLLEELYFGKVLNRELRNLNTPKMEDLKTDQRKKPDTQKEQEDLRKKIDHKISSSVQKIEDRKRPEVHNGRYYTKKGKERRLPTPPPRRRDSVTTEAVDIQVIKIKGVTTITNTNPICHCLNSIVQIANI